MIWGRLTISFADSARKSAENIRVSRWLKNHVFDDSSSANPDCLQNPVGT
jgi:hypothetical protein